MTTRPLGPPPILNDDPGPWSVAASVHQWAGSPGRRRAQPPLGFMISPPPQIDRELAGLSREGGPAGVGAIRVIAGAREPARRLWFEGEVLHGISPHVTRSWSVPDLSLLREDRPGEDPAAGLPDAASATELGESELPGAVEAPGGGYLAVHVREPRADVIAILRPADRAIVRWMRGVRACAWSDDGALVAFGADWGVVLAEPR
jgi:hypothetical protein